MRTKCRSKLQETEEYGVECGSQFSNRNQAQGSGGENNECSNAWMEHSCIREGYQGPIW